MNYQSHNSRPQNAADNCTYCHGTGWMNVEYTSGGQTLTGVKRCVCRTRELAAQDKERPGGFESTAGILRGAQDDRGGALDAVLNETDRKIARLIEGRKGQEQAIQIDDIICEIWPGWSGWGADKYRRSVKQTVEKLRMLARMPIAATKRPPYGYYIPVTAEE